MSSLTWFCGGAVPGLVAGAVNASQRLFVYGDVDVETKKLPTLYEFLGASMFWGAVSGAGTTVSKLIVVDAVLKLLSGGPYSGVDYCKIASLAILVGLAVTAKAREQINAQRGVAAMHQMARQGF